ncbi:MAG: hypothetical protein ACI9AT_001074, partial [Ulvibacter sp.]
PCAAEVSSEVLLQVSNNSGVTIAKSWIFILF